MKFNITKINVTKLIKSVQSTIGITPFPYYRAGVSASLGYPVSFTIFHFS